MKIFKALYDLWMGIVNSDNPSPLGNLIYTMGSPIKDLILDASSGLPESVLNGLTTVINIIPSDWTLFGFMFGGLLLLFVSISVIKWLIGIFT